MDESFRIPEMKLTPGHCGSIRITMKSGQFSFQSRIVVRHILSDLGLGIPEWLYPENDDD